MNGWGPIDTGWLLTIAMILLVESIALPQRSPDGGPKNKLEEFLELKPSEMGDTLAGIFAALALVWIIVTVFLQSNELKEQRKVLQSQRLEFKAMNASMLSQRFEMTFFEMLSAHNEIVRGIDLYNSETGQTTSGRDCFKVFYTRFTKVYREKQKKGHNGEICLEIAYRNFWKRHQLELSHYFRFLYNVLKFLSENRLTEEYHGKLFRSQLSDQELLIIFYNCLSPQGERLIEYVEEFQLFDNLPTVRLLDKSHTGRVPKGSFGDNPMLTFKDMRHSINIGRKGRT
ncbi:putative phage abortive infection protein [uncultured Sulfitobacter sp.]|uniref:putative phage abortive infection protein n=1 Tax=uncultured Sulfitobacter sp. TaxID=191468 RepID=UPI002622FB3B|nr:putative phage abortive infection protein [uncultured Sulfitobacter sp.]